jgi:hypothetical protein
MQVFVVPLLLLGKGRVDVALLLLRDSNLALQLHPSHPLGAESLQVIKSPFNRSSIREEQEEYRETENHTTKSKVLAHFRWIFPFTIHCKTRITKKLYLDCASNTYNATYSAYLLISPFLG